MSVEDCLLRQSVSQPDIIALTDGERALTYAQLWVEVEACAETLKGEEHLIFFHATSSLETVVRYFAIHRAGRVAVPLEKDLPAQRMEEIKTLCRSAEVGSDTADVLFTTGTTGRQKGVMISHKALLANSGNLIDAQGFAPGLTFVVNGPLNHIGSLSKIHPTLMVGGTVHLVDGLKNPNTFFAAMDGAKGKTATFLVPSHIRMLLQMYGDEFSARADRIDFIETGAAPMAQADMQMLCRALPHTRLYNTYASTETGIIATYNYNDGRCVAGCLGRPMKHSQIAITPDDHIVCSGKTIMSGYLGDEALTATILHDGAVHTSDVGTLDNEGMLHLEGRSDDVINTGGFKVAPTEVEDAALGAPGVKDCICIAAPHPVLGRALKLLVVCADGQPLDKRGLARYLKERLETHKVPLMYEAVTAIRRTFNGKPDRKSYRED